MYEKHIFAAENRLLSIPESDQQLCERGLRNHSGRYALRMIRINDGATIDTPLKDVEIAIGAS